jgi:hypothetical protein
MNMVAGLTRMLSRVFGSKSQPLDRSKLVGIYFSGANDRSGYSSEIQENRTRRNGKFSHQRERV